jgi:hypothetical protein
MLRRVVWSKFTDVSEVLTASIIRAIQDDRSDEGGSKNLWNVVNFYESTRRNIPEDSLLLLASRYICYIAS